MRFSFCTAAFAAAVVLFTAACDPGAGTESAANPADSVSRPALDGLSPAQIERRAEPMSPERAAELGIIDSTISIGGEP